MNSTLCHCDSGKPFTKCCKPFIEGTARPKTPKQLMRSRYSAYAAGGYGNYLLDTWHPDARASLNALSLSAKSQDWQSLEIVHAQQENNWAMIEFRATYLNQKGAELVHHELSRFVRVSGHWYYIDGEVSGDEENRPGTA